MKEMISFTIETLSCRDIEKRICKECGIGYPTNSNVSDKDLVVARTNNDDHIEFSISAEKSDIHGQMHIYKNAANKWEISIYNYTICN